MKLMNGFLGIISLLSCQSVFANSDQTKISIISYFWNTPVITVEIQNIKLPVQFDLGDTNTMVDLFNYVLPKIITMPSQAKDCAADINGAITCRRHYIISQIKIGDFIIHHVDSRTLDKIGGNVGGENPPIESIKAIQGVLGLNFMSKNNLGILIDYPHNQIILTQNNVVPQGIHLDEWIKMPFTLDDGIITSMIISGHSVKMLWDTGASHSAVLLGKHNQYLRPLLCKKLACDKVSLNVVSATSKRDVLAEFMVWPVDFSIADALVGYDFFEKHAVFINFRDKNIFVEP